MKRIGIVPRKDPSINRMIYSLKLIEAMRKYSLLPIFLFEENQFIECDGFILAGGKDIHPDRYHEPCAPSTQLESTETEEMELAVFNYAYEHGLPLLGICRGMQIIQVGMKGTLCQHIDAHTHCWHEVYFRDHTKALVYSDHHQCLQHCAEGLEILATGTDGIIEAIAYKNIIGVQWHPEMEEDSVLLASFFKCILSDKIYQHQNRKDGNIALDMKQFIQFR